MFCLKCGKELREDAVFCDGCGAKLDVVEQKTTKDAPDIKVSKGKFITGIVLCIIALLFIICAIFSPDSLIMFDDKKLDAIEIASLMICILGFGAPGLWLIYKSNK